MPIIDVYAVKGTFTDKSALLKDLTAAMMKWEHLPAIPFSFENTCGYIHDIDADSVSNAQGDSNYVRVQVLTPLGALGRVEQIGAVKEITELVVEAAGDPTLIGRTWVLITETPDGGWGIDGHALTNADIGAAIGA